jgi:hypothetical protein
MDATKMSSTFVSENDELAQLLDMVTVNSRKKVKHVNKKKKSEKKKSKKSEKKKSKKKSKKKQKTKTPKRKRQESLSSSSPEQNASKTTNDNALGNEDVVLATEITSSDIVVATVKKTTCPIVKKATRKRGQPSTASSPKHSAMPSACAPPPTVIVIPPNFQDVNNMTDVDIEKLLNHTTISATYKKKTRNITDAKESGDEATGHAMALLESIGVQGIRLIMEKLKATTTRKSHKEQPLTEGSSSTTTKSCRRLDNLIQRIRSVPSTLVRVTYPAISTSSTESKTPDMSWIPISSSFVTINNNDNDDKNDNNDNSDDVVAVQDHRTNSQVIDVSVMYWKWFNVYGKKNLDVFGRGVSYCWPGVIDGEFSLCKLIAFYFLTKFGLVSLA